MHTWLYPPKREERRLRKVIRDPATGLCGVMFYPTEEEMRRAEQWYRLGVELFERKS